MNVGSNVSVCGNVYSPNEWDREQQNDDERTSDVLQADTVFEKWSAGGYDMAGYVLILEAKFLSSKSWYAGFLRRIERWGCTR